MFRRILNWWQHRQEIRSWKSQHLDFIRLRVSEDLRWLAHDKVAREITERYENITAPNWYQLRHEDIAQFRNRIGLQPDYSRGSTTEKIAVDAAEKCSVGRVT